VEPSPLAVKGTEIIWPKASRIVNGRDLDVYQENALYPSSSIEKVLKGQMREWKFADVQVAPYRYNPVIKQLQHLDDGELVVTFHRIPQFRLARTTSPMIAGQFRDNMRQSVVNFNEMIGEYEHTPHE
jgi:hypothetical protein